MSDTVIVYCVSGLAGLSAGFIRFVRSKRTWTPRAALGMSTFGAMEALIICGLWFGEDVQARRFTVLSVSLLVGFVQPETVLLLEMAAKLAGINLNAPRDGQNTT